MRSSNKKIIAIFVADIHLQLNAPVWRSNEPDWFAAMKRPLDEIKDIQKKYNCPVICAGDVFDRWNSPPELINFAIENLPFLYSIPGQHDLPLHSYDDIKKSAYWTLVKAGRLLNLPHNEVLNMDGNITLHGFPFGSKITPPNEKYRRRINIAITHQYVWMEGHSYKTAPIENEINTKTYKQFANYDISVFGDNHCGFMGEVFDDKLKKVFFNCGSLMRRHSDQIDYRPQIGLLYEDGFIMPHYLDISKDKYIELEGEIKLGTISISIKSFIDELEKLCSTDLDFHETMKQCITKSKISKAVENIILRAMENGCIK